MQVLAQAEDQVASLLADLADDGVAVQDDATDVGALDAAQDRATQDLEDIQVVVLAEEPVGGAEALANQLADATGGTVLVYTPTTVAAASRSQSDAAIESALSSGSLADPVQGTESFAGTFASSGIGLTAIMLIAVALLVPTAVVGRWWERRRSSRADAGVLSQLGAPVRATLDRASDLVVDLDGRTLVAGDDVDRRFGALAADYRVQRERAESDPPGRDEATQWQREATQLVDDLNAVQTAVGESGRPGNAV